MATTSRWPAAVAFTTPATTVVAGACTAPRSAAGRQPCARPHIPGPREKHAACNDDQREHRANDANSLKSREHIRPCRCGSLLIFRQHLVVAGLETSQVQVPATIDPSCLHQSGDRYYYPTRDQQFSILIANFLTIPIVDGESPLPYRLDMRSSLEHLPERKQRELARVVEIIHEEFADALEGSSAAFKKRGRILKIILFGPTPAALGSMSRIP